MRRQKTPSSAALGALLLAAASACASPAPHAAAAKPHPVAVSAPRSAAAPKPLGPCTAAQLTVAPAAHATHDGLELERFAVRAAASAPGGCTVSGLPQLMPYGPLPGQSGGPSANLAVSQNPFPDGSLPSADAAAAAGAANGAPIAVTAAHPAYFELGWYDASSVVCEQVTGFGFDVAGDPSWTGLQRVAYPLGAMCDGLFYATPFTAG